MNLSQTTLSKMPDEELLEVLLPKSIVRELISQYGSVQGIFLDAYPEELAKIRGIGPIKAKQLKAVCEMSKRLYRATAKPPVVIRTPQDAFDHVNYMQQLAVEQFHVLLLNTKNNVIADELISQGTINASIVSTREIFNKAVRRLAAAMILVHNHPSGDPEPSQEDIALTEKVVAAGRLMEINVLDHVIVGKGRHVSLKEKGLI